MLKKTTLLITVILSWLGLGIQLALLLSNTPENGMTGLQAVGRFLLFFTVLSNILVAITTTMLLLSRKNSFLSQPETLAAITVYILIVGLVYNIILRSLWQPEGWQLVADNLLHVAVPLLYSFYWWKWINNKPIKWKYALYWLLFPAVYLAYALLRGALEGFYPYPFLDVNLLGYKTVFGNAAAMMVVFVVAGVFIVGLSRKRRLD